jgi:hypothetical protein
MMKPYIFKNLTTKSHKVHTKSHNDFNFRCYVFVRLRDFLGAPLWFRFLLKIKRIILKSIPVKYLRAKCYWFECAQAENMKFNSMRIPISVRCLTIVILCGFTFMVSCKKEPEKIYVQDSFKEWACFQNGSYWIYLNESSNRSDSSSLYYGPSTWFYKLTGDGKLYEMNSYQIQNIGEFRVGARVDYSFFSVQGIFLHGTYVLTSSVTSGLSDQVSQTCWVLKRYDSLTVNNQLFSDVIHTRDTFSNSINDYYVAKNVGLIKFAIKNGYGDSTWSLLRYHVIQ